MPLMFRAITLVGLFACAPAAAQGFSALISPPRFEARAQPGNTYRNIVEITNVSSAPARYHFKTADWTLDAEGGVTFSDALAPRSCRPWVGIEAADITLGANAKRRYRFEAAVPADAPRGECRFAILVEGEPAPAAGGVPVPVSGRIGIIVYLAIGAAAPKLEVVSQRVQDIDGRAVPVLSVRNGGDAHGRLEGFIDGTDAKGRRYTFTPSNLPILAGETRGIALTPDAEAESDTPPTIEYPLKLSGQLESGAERVEIDATLAP